MTLLLTPYTPRQQWGLNAIDASLPPAVLRQSATGESDETVRAELTGASRLIPTAAPGQALGEARIFHALMNTYGRHRATLSGGPFGIRSLTPRPDELLVRIAPSQLPRWIDALAYRKNATDGGVPGLRWAPHGADTLLTVAETRIILSGIDEHTWCTALAERDADDASLLPQWLPVIAAEAEQAAAQATDLAGIGDHLSATFRRIRLVDRLTRNGHVHLFTTRHLGELYLIEACEATPTVLPLWISQSLPLALWPASRTPVHGNADPHAAVLDWVTTVEPAAAPASAAHALCHLAGRPAHPTMLRAAEHVLTVAARVLADPVHAGLYDAGGWAGSCRTYPEGSVHGADPCIPPGAEEVTDLPAAELLRLGARTAGPAADDTAMLDAGHDELVHLLDWSLAAATRPRSRPTWSRHDDGTLNATMPLPTRPGALTLTASTTGVYRTRLEHLDLPDLEHEDDTVEWEREAAPSQAAAVLLAEHAAIEAMICLPFQREHRKSRLLLPAIPPADPTQRTVIAGADLLLGFHSFASALTLLRYRADITHGAADGHWQPDPAHPDDPYDYAATLTAYVSEWFDLPSPHHEEEANTASVDSPAYRAHLAAHRAAFDPFVTRYLAAADELTGPRSFAERHLAGVAALRCTDLSALACHDLRPVRSSLLRLIQSIPQDPEQLAAWYEHYLDTYS